MGWLSRNNAKQAGLIDRRHGLRLKERMVIRYQGLKEGGTVGPSRTGITRDISPSGLNFACRQSDGLRPLDVLDVEIPLPGQGSIRMTCRVLGVQPDSIGSEDLSEVRVAFVHVADDDRRKISGYIDDRLSIFGYERRPSERLVPAVSIRAVLTLLGYPNLGPRNCAIEDLSLGGLRIITGDSRGLAVGEKLSVSFQLNGKAVVVSCQVVWVSEHPSPAGPLLRMGVQFTDLSEPGHQEIKEFWSKHGMR